MIICVIGQGGGKRMRNRDIQSEAIFQQYEAAAKKNTILDPVKGDKYLKQKKKQKRLAKLAEQYEDRVRVMY